MQYTSIGTTVVLYIVHLCSIVKDKKKNKVISLFSYLNVGTQH